MSERCPTCGQLVVDEPPQETTTMFTREGDLVAALRAQVEGQVYRIDGSNEWAITRIRGVRVAADLVKGMVAARVLRRAYSTCDDAFWLGPTIDIEATLELRKQTRNRNAGPVLYDDARP